MDDHDPTDRRLTAGDLIARGVDPNAVARLPVREVGPRGPWWRPRDVAHWLEFEAARACTD